MNREAVRAVRDLLLDEARMLRHDIQFNMGTFITAETPEEQRREYERYRGIPEPGTHPCRTTACIAGAALLQRPDTWPEFVRMSDEGDTKGVREILFGMNARKIERLAGEVLGIQEVTRVLLFMDDGWDPQPYNVYHQCCDDADHRGMARVGAGILDMLLALGERQFLYYRPWPQVDWERVAAGEITVEQWLRDNPRLLPKAQQSAKIGDLPEDDRVRAVTLDEDYDEG